MSGSLCHRSPGRLCFVLLCLLSLWNTGESFIKGESKKERNMMFVPTTVSGNKEVKKENDEVFLDATELPARSVDLSALNLTELVNGMLSKALKDNRKFFSLLSITSYSSFAFHKFSVAIYNISNLKTVDPAKFPNRYCYCLNNRTNDLSDFTALLVDIIGNSTSYLTEIFKSTSILSVSQMDESDCIFICVMTGKAGRNISDFWKMAEKSPVINYTFTSSMSGILAPEGTDSTLKITPQSQDILPRTNLPHGIQSPKTSTLGTVPWIKTATPSKREWTLHTDPAHLPWITTMSSSTSLWQPASKAVGITNSGGLSEHPAVTTAIPGSPSQTRPAVGTFTATTQTPSPTKAPAPKSPQTGYLPAAWPFTPGKEAALAPVPHQVSRCPQPFNKEGTATAFPLTLAIQKFNPCMMELCRYFQQCLCLKHRRNTSMEAMRYCLEYYSWFLKNATRVCQKVKRVSHSRTLKQKCLENICKSV
ncbi:HERV-H LTR-associating protein 1 [Suncus etruscus]|uniref:HERV-H LTR-associating protein 1 n=1 Tax=Suncus etruscus TaxID=109475 RepID=UPI00210F734F|nr:HERV-H LTR-associating protein 1 [Suncus etruscus]